jgi:two-component system, OmpR family, sensor kinase
MSIRIRLALIFAAAGALVIVVGSLIYMKILTHELHTTIDSGLALQVQDIRSDLSRRGSTPRSALQGVAELQRDDLAQIYSPSGQLLATSSTAGTAPLLDPADVRRAQHDRFVEDPKIRIAPDSETREHVRLMAAPLDLGRGRGVVVVGTTLVWTDAALDHISDTAQWGGPILVGLAALAAWLLAAAALRPVERMRRQAAAISAEQGPSQIAVPGTHDELAALARTMNDLLVRLQDALSRERAFVADAGHELRTPLAILCTELELASRPGRSAAELRDAVHHAAEESERLSRLAADLLVLARDDAGLAPQREPTVVRDLIKSAETQVASRAVAAGVTVEDRVSPDLVADLDPTRVRRLLDNLLDNALRYLPAGGVVIVEARPLGDRLHLSVADSGPGFPAEFLPRAFERFRRADASRAREQGGAGLGLAIVKSIAEAHGGTVRATNRAQGGAEVTVTLPGAILTEPAVTVTP